MFPRRTVILLVFLLLFTLALTASAQQKAKPKAKLTPAEAKALAKQAYIMILQSSSMIKAFISI